MRWIFLVCLSFYVQFLFAQNIEPNDSLIATDNTTKISELKDIKDSLLSIEQEIKVKQTEITGTSSKQDIANLEDEIKVLEQEKKQYWEQFIEVSTGVTLQERQVGVPLSKRDLVKELQELLAPIFDTLRRASERPRRIEKLKNEIYNLQEELRPREDALKKLKDLIIDSRFAGFNAEIDQTTRLLERETREIQVELSYNERQLKKELGEKRTFMDEAQDLFASFIKNKGKNLLFFFLTFIFVFWFALWSRKRIFNLKIWENERFEFLAHPLKGLYGFIAFLLALGASVLCLYLLHDWVLVTLFIILFAGITWSLKHIFPRFIQEARLILNLGTVREGERVVWNGVSFKVVKLGLTSLLRNESLEGGTMKIASKDLISLYSRPVVEGESWFPTKKGDWVLIDKSLAQIIAQTPEQIIFEKIGGSRKTLLLADFWKLNVENLSYGFAIELFLPLDLSLQAIATSDVENNLKKIFEEKYLKKEGIREYVIQYHSIGVHGLIYYVCLNCEGVLASKRSDLERQLNITFIEACNFYGYKIPAEQLTIHMQQE